MMRIVEYLAIFLIILLSSCNTNESPGCADPLADNAAQSANENDGSCSYDPAFISPYKTLDLDEMLRGTSGLIFLDGLLWTHNDARDTRLYGIDSSTAEITMTYVLPEVTNTDWEDIAQDGEYIYVGDFGNNASGSRTDLHILRIEILSLKAGDPSIDTIWFSYEDQPDPEPAGPNRTEYDCEALVVTADSIYLFTKQWISGHTSQYALPKQAGEHIARKRASFDIQGLVTGATLLESDRLLVLCAYTGTLQPFLYLLYDYAENDFFSGNKRRLNILIPFSQTEGITTSDGLRYYVSSEYLNIQPSIKGSQQLHSFDLSEFLHDFLYQDQETSRFPD